MKKFVKLVNKLMVYGFFAIGVVLLFHGTGRVSTMLSAFGSFISSIFFAWLLRIKKIDDKYMIYINLGLLFGLFGEIIFYYVGPLLYDKLLHFCLGILLSAIVYNYYRNISELKKDSVFITVIGLLAIWEIGEFILDTFFGFQSQGIIRNSVFIQSKIDDTMYDLILGAIGSLGYLFFKKEKVDVLIKKDVSLIKRDVSKIGKYVRNKKWTTHLKDVLREMFSWTP